MNRTHVYKLFNTHIKLSFNKHYSVIGVFRRVGGGRRVRELVLHVLGCFQSLLFCAKEIILSLYLFVFNYFIFLNQLLCMKSLICAYIGLLINIIYEKCNNSAKHKGNWLLFFTAFMMCFWSVYTRLLVTRLYFIVAILIYSLKAIYSWPQPYSYIMSTFKFTPNNSA